MFAGIGTKHIPRDSGAFCPPFRSQPQLLLSDAFTTLRRLVVSIRAPVRGDLTGVSGCIANPCMAAAHQTDTADDTPHKRSISSSRKGGRI